jgi:hypothetical protein
MNQENQALLSRRELMGRAAMGAGAVAALLGGGAIPALAQATAAPGTVTTQTGGGINPVVAQTATAPATPATTPTPAPPSVSPADIEIANFALTLERLEAAYYAQIQGAHQERAYLSPRLLETAVAIGANELAHVQILEQAIIAAGGTPVPAAVYRFPNNVFISKVAYPWFGFTLEEIGIGAYLGAIGQIQNADLRRAAASIYGSEVRHAAVLRSLGGFTIAPRYFETPLTMAQVQELISPYLA